MSMISSLLSLSGAGTGYAGGKCVDEMPHLSMTEACAEFPVAICEMQREFAFMDRNHNDAMVEAVVNSAMYGTDIDTDALMESAFDTLKTKVTAFFEKILKFIRSIKAKIQMYIDKATMSGKQLVARYKEQVNKKDLDGLTMTGYEFTADSFENEVKKASSSEDIIKLVSTAVGKDVKNPIGLNYGSYKAGEEPEDIKKDIEVINDASADTRVGNIVKELTGGKVDTKSDIKGELKKYLYGGTDKKEMKYGSTYGNGGFVFTREKTVSYLENPVDLTKIRESYDALQRAAEDQKKTFTTSLEKMQKDKDNASDENAQRGMQAAITYFNAFLKVLSDCYTAINLVRDAKVRVAQEKEKQYRNAFSKMMTYKKSKDNSDFEIDAFDEFDFEI